MLRIVEEKGKINDFHILTFLKENDRIYLEKYWMKSNIEFFRDN